MIDRMRPAEAGFGLAVVRPLRSFAGSRGGCGRLVISFMWYIYSRSWPLLDQLA